MRRLMIAGFVAMVMSLSSVTAQAADIGDERYLVTEDHYVDGFSHPLRIAAYAIAPIGYAAEWLIFRPFHYIISRPQLSNVFNYEEGDDKDIRF